MILQPGSIVNNASEHLKSANAEKWDSLIKLINQVNEDNPYKGKALKYSMWQEQTNVNFPILYLSSIYLYIYAKQRNCNIFLFATRDCSHWHKIFSKLFPSMKVHYFNCSRNMFEKAIKHKNSSFNEYVSSLFTNLDETVYIDLHGTGKRMFRYFRKEFKNVPHCFLLSATYKNYSGFPLITKYYNEEKKLLNLVFDSKGSPIEMLNYDLIGTLQDYSSWIGPIRDKLEYEESLIKPYHNCMDHIIEKLAPFNNLETIEKDYNLEELNLLIEKMFKCIKQTRPSLANYMSHTAKHKAKNEKNINVNEKIFNRLTFDEILSRETTYGLIWDGKFDGESCVIKMVMLSSGIVLNETNLPKFHNNDKKPFKHNEFINKKVMNKSVFLNEVKNITYLSNVGLAPKVFGYWICDKLFDIHYGFIVMRKMNYSLKDVILKRSIRRSESKLIESMIDKLHNNYDIVHGDLKPSNIGVNLDKKGKIKKCLLFDCQKIKHKEDYGSSKFRKLRKHDWNNYYKHISKNKKEAKEAKEAKEVKEVKEIKDPKEHLLIQN